MKLLERTFTNQEVIDSIIHRQCLICHKNLDENLKTKDWHLPFCRDHRTTLIQEEFERNKK